MFIRWMVAALHLLGLGIGLGAVWARGRAFRGPLDAAGLKRVFYADGLWGLAAVIWISTGLARAFAGLEKGSTYYLTNHLFWAKMALLGGILALEMAPMIALIRWRTRVARGEPVDTSKARTFSVVSFVQAGLVIAMVIAASGMARGWGH